HSCQYDLSILRLVGFAAFKIEGPECVAFWRVEWGVRAPVGEGRSVVDYQSLLLPRPLSRSDEILDRERAWAAGPCALGGNVADLWYSSHRQPKWVVSRSLKSVGANPRLSRMTSRRRYAGRASAGTCAGRCRKRR